MNIQRYESNINEVNIKVIQKANIDKDFLIHL